MMFEYPAFVAGFGVGSATNTVSLSARSIPDTRGAFVTKRRGRSATWAASGVRRSVVVAVDKGSAVASSPQKVVTTSPSDDLLVAVAIEDKVERRDRVSEAILELEGLPGGRPETALFAEFGFAGRWEFIFTTGPAAQKSDREVTVKRVVQEIVPEEKSLKNECYWSFLNDEGECVHALMEIVCKYGYDVESMTATVEIDSHQMKILGGASGGKVKLPQDMQSVVEALQVSLPLEIWDPSGPLDLTTYMDPGVRISCVMGQRLQGVRTVFRRENVEA